MNLGLGTAPAAPTVAVAAGLPMIPFPISSWSAKMRGGVIPRRMREGILKATGATERARLRFGRSMIRWREGS